MKNTDHQTCQNCFHSFHGTYCFNCGQKNTVRRFQLVEILKELLLTPFHMEEHGLTGTFKSLLLHPGRAIREYIEGRRLLLFAPFRYVVLAGAFAAIIAAVYHVFEVGENFDGVVLLQYIDPSFFVFAGKNATAINLLTIPVFALFTWLFFKPKGYYYAENLVLHAYITAQQLWFLVLLLPLFHFFPSINNEVIQVYSFVTILYNLYVVMSFFNMITLTGFGLSLLALVYSYIFQLVVNYGFFTAATGLGIATGH